MESTVEIYSPSRLYARMGWATLAGSFVCALCGMRAPFALIPAMITGLTSGALFWLASRPRITTGETQFTIGERTIAWREVREINTSRFVSPLVLDLRLTNGRRKLLVFPGEHTRIEKLVYQLRKNAHLATFDGVSYKDYWTWTSLGGYRGETPTSEQPVRMVSTEDEEEIERLYQRLKAVGHLDSRTDSQNSHE